MTASRAFYATYREGMKLVFGNSPDLVAELEVYGGGLETTPPLDIGGPLVAHLRSSRRTVIGWIRGLPSSKVVGRGRVAWEAWGILASPGVSISAWPTHWEMLKECPPNEDRLTKMADMIETGFLGPDLPPLPANLVSWLTKIHYEAAKNTECQQFLLPIRTPEEIPLLPWVWLLGPIPPTHATLGPPRQIPTAITPPLTYEGKVSGEQITFGLEESTYLSDLVNKTLPQGLTFALSSINNLREQKPEIRMKWLGSRATNSTLDINTGSPLPVQERSAPKPVVILPTPTKSQVGIAQSELDRGLARFKRWFRSEPEPPTPPIQNESRPEKEDAHQTRQEATPSPLPTSEFTDLRRRTDFIIAALILIMALQIWSYLMPSPPKGDAEPTTSATYPNSTNKPAGSTEPAGKTNKVEPPSNITIPLVAGTASPASLAEALLRRLSLQLQVSNNILNLLAKITKSGAPAESPQQQLSPSDKKRLANAAVQIYLIENQCVQPNTIIDGEIGDTAEQGFIRCPDARTYLLNNQDQALSWLNRWLQSPSLEASTPQP